nr:hypothetical protein BaRGS_011713 [Batillaria attramentaria]
MGSVLAGVLALVLMLHGAESVQWSPSLEDGAVFCLPKDDPALEGATFNIDKVDARLMLLEAENADLRTQVKALEKSATFHARLTSNSPVNTGDHIILTDVIINEGNVYNSSTGEFTAPYDGSYFFTATAVSAMYSNTTDQFANVDLMVDGDIVTYIWTKSVNYLETGTCSYTTHLNKGQRVWLQADYHGIFRAPETSFSGFLLSADD